MHSKFEINNRRESKMKQNRKTQLFYTAARAAMIDCQIRPDGVLNEGIIKSFGQTPRENFLPDDLKGIAYIDDILSADRGHFVLSPSVHARMLEAVNPRASDIVLDISVSDGYSSAILSPLVSTVIAVEEDESMTEKRAVICADNELLNVVCVDGTLNEGAPDHAPFDLIFMHGAAPALPTDIAAQLKDGGRMVYIEKALGDGIGRAVLVQKTTQDAYSTRVLFETSAPYLTGFAPSKTFTF